VIVLLGLENHISVYKNGHIYGLDKIFTCCDGHNFYSLVVNVLFLVLGGHLRQVCATLRRTRSTSDGAKLPGYRYPPWNDSRRETLKIPTVQRFPKGTYLTPLLL